MFARPTTGRFHLFNFSSSANFTSEGAAFSQLGKVIFHLNIKNESVELAINKFGNKNNETQMKSLFAVAEQMKNWEIAPTSPGRSFRPLQNPPFQP